MSYSKKLQKGSLGKLILLFQFLNYRADIGTKRSRTYVLEIPIREHSGYIIVHNS